MSETYVWRAGHWVSKTTGKPMEIPERDGVCAPMMILSDIEPHVAPTGEIVNTRSDRDELRKKHGLVPYERLTGRPRGYINDKFARKRGLKTCGETKEHFAEQKKTALAKAGLA